MERTKPKPQFVAITWEEIGEEGTSVTVRAVLCLLHRKEIAFKHPSARGSLATVSQQTRPKRGKKLRVYA